MTDTRTEHDSLGDVEVPADRLWGAQTQRAVENFPVSGIRFSRPLIRALGLIKKTAAEVNADLGLLDDDRAGAIEAAATEVANGQWDEHFPIDIFQTGSGTSTNMNANEVIARRGNQILEQRAAEARLHPNDHVNLGQSSNDVIPTAIHVSAYLECVQHLIPSLGVLTQSLRKRARDSEHIVKTGRTHLMDAMPVTFGQEFGGWAYQMQQAIERLETCLPRLAKLPLGGTAVGTGINTHPEFGSRVALRLEAETGQPFVEAENHFAAQSAMDTPAELSAHLKTTAGALMKIANDLRWSASGPLAGLGEITMPALQPGSSIMPGKVNPVICESVMMTCAQVIGNDLTVTLGNEHGNFQLNVMLPVIAHNLLESIHILGNAARLLAKKCIDGLVFNEAQVRERVERNPVLVTALNPVIGYDKAAEIAKEAYRDGRKVKDVAAEKTQLDRKQLDEMLDPRRMVEGGLTKS
jgi:fumarate hydratase class II